MTGIALLMPASPGIIPHFGIDRGPIAMAIDIAADLGCCDILGRRHADNSPLIGIDFDIDRIIEMGGLRVAGNIDGVIVAIGTSVLTNPLGTGQPSVAVGLHAYRAYPEVGLRTGAGPIMTLVAKSIPWLVGIIDGIDHILDRYPTVMADVTLGVDSLMSVT